MTAAKLSSTSGIGARLIKAKHREIAIRYRQGKKPPSMAALRCAQLRRLFTKRYGGTLPNDDAGKDDAFIMANHLALISGDQRERVTSWIAISAPWMTEDELALLLDQVLARPLRWRADKLAVRLNLTEAERRSLSITTIGACDMTKPEREEARKARKLHVKRKQRRAQGVKPRAEYEEAAAGHGKPWIAAGISRATWYRRQQGGQQ